MAKTKQAASVGKQIEKPAKTVPKSASRQLKDNVERVKSRFKTTHIVAAAAAFLLILIGGIAIFNQTRSLNKVSKQITTLEQKSTESQDRVNSLLERVEKVESELAEQKEKTGPEALEAQFIEYYEKIDKKTNTLIGVVVAAAVLVFTTILLGGIFLIFRSYKDIERKLDGARKV